MCVHMYMLPVMNFNLSIYCVDIFGVAGNFTELESDCCPLFLSPSLSPVAQLESDCCLL